MAQASINIKPVKPNSNNHNLRLGSSATLNYIDHAKTKNNEYWTAPEYKNPKQYRGLLEIIAKDKTKRKMQTKATPIREAVVNLNHHHTLDDVKNLALEIQDKFNIKPLQIAIHRDEGQDKEEGHINHHAHIVFDWLDHPTGKSIKMNRIDMVDLQTLTADSLNMERGEFGSKAVRLEAQAYKQSQEIIKQDRRLQEQKQQLNKQAKKKETITSCIALAVSEKELNTFLKDEKKEDKDEQKELQELKKKLEDQNTKNKNLSKQLEEKRRISDHLRERLKQLKMKLKPLQEEIKNKQTKGRERNKNAFRN